MGKPRNKTFDWAISKQYGVAPVTGTVLYIRPSALWRFGCAVFGADTPARLRALSNSRPGRLGAVDRTLSARPATCSPRHLTSHLTLLYKHSFNSLTLSFPSGVISVCPGYKPEVLRQRESC